MSETCSKSKIRTPERRQWHCCSEVYIVSFKQILHTVLVLPSLILDKSMLAGNFKIYHRFSSVSLLQHLVENRSDWRKRSVPIQKIFTAFHLVFTKYFVKTMIRSSSNCFWIRKTNHIAVNLSTVSNISQKRYVAHEKLFIWPYKLSFMSIEQGRNQELFRAGEVS